jgi:hypothetical protein
VLSQLELELAEVKQQLQHRGGSRRERACTREVNQQIADARARTLPQWQRCSLCSSISQHRKGIVTVTICPFF